MNKPFSPMLAYNKEYDIARDVDLSRGYMVSEKLDGIRCCVINGVVQTRTGKPIPNRYISSTLMQQFKTTCNNRILDGEICCIDVAGNRLTFNETQSAVMSEEGQPLFEYHIFDTVFNGNYNRSSISRYINLTGWYGVLLATENINSYIVKVVPQYIAYNLKDVKFHWTALSEKRPIEGLMLKYCGAGYKCGRCTLREGWLLKYVEYEHRVAVITGATELQVNTDTSCKKKENLIPGGMLGCLIVNDQQYGQLKLGSGFTQEQRYHIWKNKSDYMHKQIEYKFKPYGMKDKPRQPVFVKFL